MNDTLGHCRYRLTRGDFRLDAGFSIPARGITGLFGPSGAGKSLLLRCLAGLEPQATGEAVLAGQTWDGPGFRLPPHARQVGMVFQDARLFPHLDVARNLRYGRRRSGGNDSALGFEAVVSLLGLETLLSRSVGRLSGGEQRRVAIGRALLRHPRLVLLDEPLSGMDRRRREEILPYLDRLHREMSVPMLFVSHRQEEVERLCDWLVAIEDGQVLIHGSLGRVLAAGVAPGLEASVMVEARVSGYDEDDDLSTLVFDGGSLLAAGAVGRPGDAVRCLVRARDVSISRHQPPASSILNVLPVTITGLDESATHTRVRLLAGRTRLDARISRRSRRRLGLELGQPVYAQIKGLAVRAVAG